MDNALSAYRASLDYLFARTTGATKFGLERTEAVLKLLGDPHHRLRAVHVAGTNGKGSVVATIDTVLRAHGRRVGRYTSPHLIDFRERIVVDGVPISEEEVVDFVERWTPEIERTGATFFEATTALAFSHFARREVDVAIIETGLGGRLDSTNVIHPVVAVVTSIGIDHTEYLGTTIQEIAGEKAGIFKRRAAAVIGERDDAVLALLEARAHDAGSDPVRNVTKRWLVADVHVSLAGTAFALNDGRSSRPARTALIGAHQASNAATALLALEQLDAHGVSVEDAIPHLERVSLPGRFQVVDQYLFDVAHNPDGARVVADTITRCEIPRPLTVLLGVLGDKDWRGMVDALAPVSDNMIITQPPTAPESRAWNPDEAGAYASMRAIAHEVILDFDVALRVAANRSETVLITGSFHTVGDAMARLQVNPLAG